MTKWLKPKICCIIKVGNRYSYLSQMISHPIMCAIIMCSFRYCNSWWNYWFHVFSTFLYASLQNIYIISYAGRNSCIYKVWYLTRKQWSISLNVRNNHIWGARVHHNSTPLWSWWDLLLYWRQNFPYFKLLMQMITTQDIGHNLIYISKLWLS